MGLRSQLHTKLETLLGSPNVYFQPPANIQMKFPCIVYERAGIRTNFADDEPYKLIKRYTVTVIDANPDSPHVDSVARLPMCTHSRSFRKNNLNHDVYNLYF